MGGPVKLQIENDALETLIQNGGAIKADGGGVPTSQAANKFASSVINTGLIEAQTLATGEKGEIILFAHGGTMNLGGTIKADGGFVETSGKHFSIAEGASVNAGHWLIDPVNIIDTTSRVFNQHRPWWRRRCHDLNCRRQHAVYHQR